jgi:sugar lactone lactonase YvrE
MTSATEGTRTLPDSTAAHRFVPTERHAVRVGLSAGQDGLERAMEGIAWDIRAAVGESPSWLGWRGVVASVDISAGILHLLDPTSAIDERVRLPHPASAAIPAGRTTLLLAAGRSLDAYAMTTGEVGPATGWPGEPPAGTAFNDAKLDRLGRLWIGARDPDPRFGRGRLLCWEAGRRPVVRAAGLRGPNGLAWNRAGDRLYLADSRQGLIFAYATDPATGELGEGRVFAAWGPGEGRPDGLAMDSDDHLWCAVWDGGAIRRYDPDGGLDRTLRVPTNRPTSCSFGGPHLDQLWVTTARLADSGPADLGGSLLAIDLNPLGIVGAPVNA